MFTRAQQSTHELIEIEQLAFERASRMFPGVPSDEIARAAHVGTLVAVRYAVPERLPQLALQEARAILSLYVGLTQMHHVPLVA